jgi:glutamate-1-semialdehyde aminotransferase
MLEVKVLMLGIAMGTLEEKARRYFEKARKVKEEGERMKEVAEKMREERGSKQQMRGKKKMFGVVIMDSDEEEESETKHEMDDSLDF